MDKELNFKNIFLYYLFFMIPFSLLFAFLSLFNKWPIQFNDKPTYGILGFVVCIAFTPLWAFLFTCLTWVALFTGRLFYNMFLKITKIKK